MRSVEGQVALGCLGTPDDIDLVVAFLASDGGCVTGQYIEPGGGFNLLWPRRFSAPRSRHFPDTLGSSEFLTLQVSALLCAVSTGIHRAPATAAAACRINEQPAAAAIVGALAHSIKLV